MIHDGPPPCASDPEAFDLRRNGDTRSATPRQLRAAETICLACPLIAGCLKQAMAAPKPPVGVVAGRVWTVRGKNMSVSTYINHGRKPSPKVHPTCGTAAGLNRHRKQKLKVCDDCFEYRCQRDRGRRIRAATRQQAVA
jgi:hypothetical protein